MERTLRNVRLISRHIQHRFSVAGLKSVAPMPYEDSGLELVTKFNQDIRKGGIVPVFRRALLFPNRVAVHDDVGIYTYSSLHQAATKLSAEIDKQLLGESGQTIAYLCSNDASHIITQWAIWITGNIAVPLTSLHPPEMLKYFIDDSAAALVICSQEYENTLAPIAKDLSRYLIVTTRDQQITAQLYQTKELESREDVGRSNIWYGGQDALIIYTSGTTGAAKGVVWSHRMLGAQLAALHAAWQYRAADVLLHALPLHHVHGQINSVNAALAAGARLRMLPSFATHTVWARLLGMGEREEAKITMFHGVPAMYAKLAADFDNMFPDAKTAAYVKQILSKMRLMCAGSAPLPASLFHKWEQISGHRLLERYGMSEVGMALSNPYRPVEERTVGSVGLPLPGVSARIVAHHAATGRSEALVTAECASPDLEISLERLGLTTKDAGADKGGWDQPKITYNKQLKDDDVIQGELQLKGPTVLTTYLNRAPKVDNSEFMEGWFRTGDTAAFDRHFRILGRASVDIIKASGYKVSALQVESAILEHPNVSDVAVLGIEDATYGEIVSALVTLKDSTKKLTLKDLNDHLSRKLSPYQTPKTMLVIDKMPRNAMGKLDKKSIKQKYGKELVLPKK